MDTREADESTEPQFDALPPGSLIDALVASERELRRAQAEQVRILGALDRAAWDCESEVSAAVRWSSGTTHNRLYEAALLVSRFPETVQALARGQVSWLQAKALAELTSCMSDEAARAVQDRVLPRISEQVLASTRAALRRAVAAVDPHGAAERHALAKTRRRVQLRPEDDGMATLSLYTAAQTARAVLTAIDSHCAERAEDDERTADQCRADALAAIILGSVGVRFNATNQNPEIPALVTVLVNVETLLEVGDTPGELIGYGPITPTQARALASAPGSVWQRLIIAPDGMAVHAEPTKYSPTASVDRHVRMYHRTCTFPGCQMPAIRSDLDHMENFDHEHPDRGGPTTCDNLHPVCRRHHNEKTNGLWHVQRIGDTIVWTSTVTGISYISRPEPYPVANTGD